MNLRLTILMLSVTLSQLLPLVLQIVVSHIVVVYPIRGVFKGGLRGLEHPPQDFEALEIRLYLS